MYIRGAGLGAGEIIMANGSAPSVLIPCDGRLVNGFDWPELYQAVRGRPPTNPDDDYLSIMHDEMTHTLTAQLPTVDRYTTFSMVIPDNVQVSGIHIANEATS